MNSKNLAFLHAGLVALLFCTGAPGALAAEPGATPPGPPPQEALAACKALKANQNCSFNAPSGSISGTCWAPEGKPLACKPKDAPNGNPPPKK